MNVLILSLKLNVDRDVLGLPDMHNLQYEAWYIANQGSRKAISEDNASQSVNSNNVGSIASNGVRKVFHIETDKLDVEQLGTILSMTCGTVTVYFRKFAVYLFLGWSICTIHLLHAVYAVTWQGVMSFVG